MFAFVLCLLAPLPKEAPPPPLEHRVVGQWTLVWGGSEYACEVGRNGTWTCANDHTTWVGSWRVEGNVWHFEESILSDDGTLGNCQEYAVEFGDGLEGRTRGGMTAALRKRP